MGEEIDLSVMVARAAPAASLVARLREVLEAAGIRQEIFVVDEAELPARLFSTRGRYVLTLDPEVAPPLVLDLWHERGTAEVLIGARTAAAPTSLRGFARRGLDRFLARWLGLPFRDVSGLLRLYDGPLLRAQLLLTRGRALHSEILVRVYAEGWRVRQLPLDVGGDGTALVSYALAHLRPFPALWRLRNSIASADYDDRAYDSVIPLQRYWQRERLRHVIGLVAGRAPVLDVGCGSSRILSALPPGSVGLDILARKLRYARRFGRRLVQASALQLPFRDGLFPGVVCSQVIEHVPLESGILDELCRVLAPDGRLVLGTPDYGSWRWRALEAVYERVAPGAYAHEHMTRYSRADVVRQMESRGLTLEAERSILKAERIFAFRKRAAPRC